jgi:hypothetical protein
MASKTQPQAEVAETQDQIQQETPPEAAEATTEAQAEAEAKPEENAAQDESSEVQVTIGATPAPEEEAESEKAPDWLKQLRKREREVSKENRDLKAALAKTQQTQSVALVVPAAPPQLRDFDWDEDRHRDAVAKWAEDEAARKVTARQREQAQSQAVEAVYADHRKKAATLSSKVKDYDAAVDVVTTALSIEQQNMILRAADDSALLTYALGKNPAKARALADIKDPVKFIAALAKTEQEVKVTPRRPASSPDQPVRGANGSPSSAGRDKEMAKAQEKASKGDATDLMRLLAEQAKKK